MASRNHSTNNAVGVQLNKYGLQAKKNLGQNFLKSSEVVEDIANSIPHTKPLTIIEVGPGLGILTKELAKKADRVIAYEIDTSLSEVLKENLADYPNVQIIYKDFLKADLVQEIPQDENHEIAFAANLPYYVTTPILFEALNSTLQITSITVMMQKEVANRFLAKENSPDYNALTVIAWYLCDIKKVRNVSRKCFVPEPGVDSTVIQLRKRPYHHQVEDTKAFFSLVKQLFHLRRKTILNNYTQVIKDKNRAEQILLKAGIDPKRRPQELSIEEFIQIFEVQSC